MIPDPFVVDVDDEELRRRGLRIVLVEHCHGSVCIADPATMTIYVSVQFDMAARSRAFARAIDALREHLGVRRVPPLRLA